MKTKLMKRLIAMGALASSAALLAGTGVAGAAPTGQGPRFNAATPNVSVRPIRSAGSETTYYLMGALGNLYTQSSIYGCVLSGTDNRTCTQNDGASTDTLDDWSRDEYTNGAGVGTGGGIKELCGLNSGGLTVDFARASRAPKSSDYATQCSASNVLPLNYADDAIQPVDFQGVGTTAIGGTPVCTTALISGGGLINGTCQIGPVAAGWLPGDPLAGPYTGAAFNNVGTLGAPSQLNKILCTTAASPITDWGQLSSTGPIGVPIYIPSVNTASGTEATWAGVAGCTTTNGNNRDNITGRDLTVQENDAPQLPLIASNEASLTNTRWPDFNTTASSDPALTGTAAQVYASNLVAATFYYVSFGVSQWKPYTATVTVAGKKTAANLMSVDNVSQSPACDYPSGACFDNGGNPVTQSNSARKLFNVVRTDTLKGSAAGFLNYVCDANIPAEYGNDVTTGKSYAQEVVYTVGTQFVFPYQNCATDSGGNPADPFVAPGQTPPAGGAAVLSANVAN